MFEDWGDFYLLVGSAAAVLIGLIFVVISLMQDRSRSTVLTGSKLYMGPIVLMVSFVLVLSAAALTPKLGQLSFAAVTTIVAAWGLVRGVMSTVGIVRLGKDVHWTDLWFYGIAPTALYAALAVVAGQFWWALPCAQFCLAGVIVGMLLLAIRNEWDLITWIAPRSDENDPSFGNE
jgi:hypothetical protein